jgi:putative endonuclease
VRYPVGELDLVAVDGRTVVFVEVKTRQRGQPDHPVEAVGPAKQRRVMRAAVSYLKAHRLMDYPCRFDVIAVVWPRSAWRPTIEHYVAAFDATAFGRYFT